MGWLQRTVLSPIGLKFLAALTGLGLVLFIIVHMLGNLQIFLPDESFNEYASGLHAFVLFPVIEIGLILAFAAHITIVLYLAGKNKEARGARGYYVQDTKQKPQFLARFLASRWMVFNGVVLLLFMIVHIYDMRLQHDFVTTELNGDLKGHVKTVLGSIWHSLLYIIGSGLVGMHVFHGLQSAFRSLAVHHPKYTPLIEKTSMGLGVALAAGFIAVPLWVLATTGV